MMGSDMRVWEIAPDPLSTEPGTLGSPLTSKRTDQAAVELVPAFAGVVCQAWLIAVWCSRSPLVGPRQSLKIAPTAFGADGF